MTIQTMMTDYSDRQRLIAEGCNDVPTHLFDSVVRDVFVRSMQERCNLYTYGPGEELSVNRGIATAIDDSIGFLCDLSVELASAKKTGNLSLVNKILTLMLSDPTLRVVSAYMNRIDKSPNETIATLLKEHGREH